VTEGLFVDEAGLELNDPPRLVWVRARDAVGLLWRENPKLHDLQTLVASVRRHSFQAPSKFDAKLFRVGQPPEDEEPLGAIKAGNGRVEAVAWLEANWEEVKADEEKMPRGLALDADGAWCVPVLVGTDAKSTSAAMEFAIDDNNSVMSGGDLDGFDMARLWDGHYVDLLSGLDELPVSVDAEMLSLLASVDDIAENWSDLDQELDDLEGYEEIDVKITVPVMHEEAVIEWLANGESKTAPGMGKGVMKRCGLL